MPDVGCRPASATAAGGASQARRVGKRPPSGAGFLTRSTLTSALTCGISHDLAKPRSIPPAALPLSWSTRGNGPCDIVLAVCVSDLVVVAEVEVSLGQVAIHVGTPGLTTFGRNYQPRQVHITSGDIRVYVS